MAEWSKLLTVEGEGMKLQRTRRLFLVPTRKDGAFELERLQLLCVSSQSQFDDVDIHTFQWRR